MNDIEKEIVLAYAENNMNVLETARKTYRHPNTIWCRMRKIKKKYGLDPKIFYDLVALLNIISADVDKIENK